MPFLEELKEHLEPKRAVARRVNQIDLASPYATLMTNYHVLTTEGYMGGHTYTVEIKPKCGKYERMPAQIIEKAKANLTLAKESPSILTNIVNSQVTEFDIKQTQKVLKGEEKYFSNYSPIQLFSGNRELILLSLKNLRACPHINLRMHRDGKLVPAVSDDLLEVVAEVLIRTKVLSRILDVQWATDRSIEEVYQSFFKACSQMKESEARTSIERVMPHVLDPAGKFKPESASDSQWLEVLKYLMSMTARDCSVMITFRAMGEGKGEPRIGHNETIVPVRGRKYAVKVGVIDFDVKLIKKVEFYYNDKIKSLTDYISYFSS